VRIRSSVVLPAPLRPRSAQTPPRATLDFSRIVQAAIEIADRDGLSALSMRKIAAQLGAGAMSLYRHIPSKEALVTLMIDAVFAETPLPEAPTGDWRADLRELAEQTWALVRRHRWLPEALLNRPPLTPNAVAGLEYALSILDGQGLEIGERMQCIGAVHSAVLNAANNAAVNDDTRARLQMTDEEIMHSAGPYIEHIFQAGHYSRVSEYIRDAEHLDDKQEIQPTVELILDGIEARITAARRRADARAAPDAAGRS
jgi:AcrR family transcriptional regulator